jgi:hypothetical protein
MNQRAQELHLGELSVAGLLSWSKGKGKPEKRGLLARHPGRVFATIGTSRRC